MPSLMQIFKHHHVTRSKFGAHPKGRFFFFFFPGRFFFVVVCRDISYNIFCCFLRVVFFSRHFILSKDVWRRNATCSLLSLKSRPCGRCFFEMCLWARASVLRRRVVLLFFFWGGEQVFAKNLPSPLLGEYTKSLETLMGLRWIQFSLVCSKTLDFLLVQSTKAVDI